MNFILWLYVFFGGACECSYERVGIFSDEDSLHIVSTKLNYHLRFESEKKDILTLSKNHPDSLFAISGGFNDEGFIMFISDLRKKETVVLSTRACGSKD